MKTARDIVLYIIFGLCILLLFVGGPRPGTGPTAQHVWDLGHIFLFALGSFILMRDIPLLSRQSFFTQLILIFVLSLVLGILSEYIQVKFHRTPDVGDLGRDILGGLLAVAFLSPKRKQISKISLLSVQIILVMLFIYQLLPLSNSLADDICLPRQSFTLNIS